MDHFILCSFVLHDKIWNLVPTFKNVNSKKSDNLLNYDQYIDKFCDLQYKAFAFVVDKKSNNQIEEYRELLRIEDAKKFKEEKTVEEFYKMVKKEVMPVYNITVNQGFGVMEELV